MYKYMLSMLMDGIKDADMMIDYAEDAYSVENEKAAAWFKNHAKLRLDMLTSDYDYINREMGLTDKAREGDPLADALLSHLNYQMETLAKRYNNI